MIQDIAPKKLDNQYRPERKAAAGAVVLHFLGRKLLCRVTENGTLELPVYEDYAGVGSEFTYLFAVDGKHYFLCRCEQELSLRGWAYQDINLFRTVQPRDAAYAAVTGFHLASWYADNRFCGRCASPTEHDGELRMLKCPKCGNMIFPKIMPSVIVAVTHGDKLLLTRYANRPFRGYALIAGFVEIGETLEDTVHREVMEEVGVRVKNLRYYKNQPWAFTDTLLTGFYCELDGEEDITLDHNELCEGVWLSREEIPSRENDVSLTAEMIERFRLGKE